MVRVSSRCTSAIYTRNTPPSCVWAFPNRPDTKMLSLLRVCSFLFRSDKPKLAKRNTTRYKGSVAVSTKMSITLYSRVQWMHRLLHMKVDFKSFLSIYNTWGCSNQDGTEFAAKMEVKICALTHQLEFAPLGLFAFKCSTRAFVL